MSNQHIVTILQKNYNISCHENEIPRLQECTDFVNSVLQKIIKSGKINSENTLMAMALLTIADELLDLKKNMASGEQQNTQIELSNTIITHNIIPDNLLIRLESLCQKMHDNV